MSAIIYSEAVDLDRLIPRVVDVDCEKDKDIDRLIPHVFKHVQFAEEYCTDNWPEDDRLFKDVFYDLDSFQPPSSDSGPDLAHNMEAVMKVTLPRKSWEIPGREFINAGFQGSLLSTLMKSVYRSIEGVAHQSPEFKFPLRGRRQKYIIGGARYFAQDVGSITVRPRKKLRVVSFAVWFEPFGQQWDAFLSEVLSVMLGQLAKNTTKHFCDQEVFVIGFYGPSIYIARGFFTTDLITRVRSKGCSENETFELKFAGGYNLRDRDNWLQAMRALTRLFRYLFAKSTNCSAMQAGLERQEHITH